MQRNHRAYRIRGNRRKHLHSHHGHADRQFELPPCFPGRAHAVEHRKLVRLPERTWVQPGAQILQELFPCPEKLLSKHVAGPYDKPVRGKKHRGGSLARSIQQRNNSQLVEEVAGLLF